MSKPVYKVLAEQHIALVEVTRKNLGEHLALLEAQANDLAKRAAIEIPYLKKEDDPAAAPAEEKAAPEKPAPLPGESLQIGPLTPPPSMQAESAAAAPAPPAAAPAAPAPAPAAPPATTSPAEIEDAVSKTALEAGLKFGIEWVDQCKTYFKIDEVKGSDPALLEAFRAHLQAEIDKGV